MKYIKIIIYFHFLFSIMAASKSDDVREWDEKFCYTMLRNSNNFCPNLKNVTNVLHASLWPSI